MKNKEMVRLVLGGKEGAWLFRKKGKSRTPF